MTNLNATLNAQDEIALDDLFAEIDSVEGALEPVIEAAPIEPSSSLEDDLLNELLDEAVEPVVEAAAPVEETPVAEEAPVIAQAEPDELDGLFDENELDLDSLTLDAPALEIEPEKKKTPKKAKAEPKPKEEKAEAGAEEEAPAKKEKSPTTYRTTYYNSSKSKVLLDRLGGDTSDIVLEFADAELSDEELKAKQRTFLSLLNNQPATTADGTTVQKKVAEKVIILFTMFKQKKGWNEVMYRTFKLLLTDGFIQSGDKGNLMQNLLAKPYSQGTARAQSGQMMQLLPLLKIANETSKGLLTLNEDSTIVARLRNEYFPELKAEVAE